MSEDRNGKTYSFDVCSQCKLICCQDANPPLTLNRKKILREYVKEQKVPVQTLFAGEEYSHPAADANGICVFYNKETRNCRVHPVKPETCRAGPVTFDINLKTRKVEFYLKKNEICALAQTLYENKEPFREHLEVAKAEILRLICELDAEALKTILKIPEPQTFKIDENELPKEVIKKLGIS
ncbi:YkgJ family cysteine cluster protein [Candidatus Bathyarchaeota archaeon]|nr:YkgJ family cysteine cluster protein [Candidatus Bathyarchaeota archaeon]